MTEKVEKTYLCFLNADLRGSFTVNFRIQRDDFPRELRCLGILAYFELGNGLICNGDEGLLISPRLFPFPERQISAEVFFSWECSRLSRILEWICYQARKIKK